MNARIQRRAERHLAAIEKKLSSIEAYTRFLLGVQKRTAADRTALLKACEAAYANVAPRSARGRRLPARAVAKLTEAQFREGWDYEPGRMRLARRLAKAIAQASR